MRLLPPTRALILLAPLVLGTTGPGVLPKIGTRPVRVALERRYEEMRDAYFAGDSSVVLATRSPDVFSITPAGDTLGSAAMRAYTRISFEQVRTSLDLDWKLGIIDVHGDTAAAEVDQHWRRRQLKGGALREVDTRAHQRETWILEDGRWLLWRIDHIRPGIWRVDGKRVDPSRPYDPNAPEYRGR